MQECGIEVPPKSSKDFISSVLCIRDDGKFFYKKLCLKGSCVTCGGLQHLQKYLHLKSTHEIGKKLFTLGKYKIVTYGVKDGKELKRCELVNTDIFIAEFMRILQEKIVY